MRERLLSCCRLLDDDDSKHPVEFLLDRAIKLTYWFSDTPHHNIL